MKRLLVVASLILGIAAPALAATDLSGDEIKAKLIGHALNWKAAKPNVAGTITYNADGTMVRNRDGSKKPRKGKWNITDNKLCEQFGKKPQSCTTVQQVDDKTFLMTASKVTVTLQ